MAQAPRESSWEEGGQRFRHQGSHVERGWSMARAQMETGSELARACHRSGTKCIRLGEGWPKTILKYTIVYFLSG